MNLKRIVKPGLAAHTTLGLVTAVLLYIICLSGTVLVLYEEWQRAEQPNAPEMAAPSPDAVQRAIETVLASEADGPPTTHLYVHFPTEGLPRTTITTDSQAVHVDADGAVAMPEENAWSEFLYALHYRLNLPALWGITLVGALGAAMLALIITGIIAHPRIFRDAFRLRARDKGGVGVTDWHNRLGVWTLPFGIAIALTGAVIGLATVAAYGLADRYYEGDVAAVYAPLFGPERAEDPAPAPMPNVAPALRYIKDNYPEHRPTYIIAHDPMTAGQHVQLIAAPPRRLIFGEYFLFDAEGDFEGTAGLSDGPLGQQTSASVYSLHFGDYGGLAVKLAYILFGLALTVITATGMSIWFGKRARRGVHEPRLRAAWDGLVWGTPAMLVLTFVLRALFGNELFLAGFALPFAAIFWIGLLAVVCGAAASAGGVRLKAGLQAATPIGLVAAFVLLLV